MPLSRLIVGSFASVVEASLWVVLLLGIGIGYSQVGLTGAVGGLVLALILEIMAFGAILLLHDIRDRVGAIERSLGGPAAGSPARMASVAGLQAGQRDSA